MSGQVLLVFGVNLSYSRVYQIVYHPSIGEGHTTEESLEELWQHSPLIS